MAGIEVVVVVESIYNGVNHKSLGLCKPGQVITVASGPYGQSLLNDGLVKRVEDILETLVNAVSAIGTTPAPDVPIADELQAEENGAWELLLESGITERQAKLIVAAGFASQEAIAKSLKDYGTSQLTEVNGVGINTALKLAKWLEIDIATA